MFDANKERQSETIRAQVLRDLLRESGADLAMCFTLREWHGATWVTGLIGEGDPWVFRHFEPLDDQPLHRPDWMKPSAPGVEADRFVDLEALLQGTKLSHSRPLDRAYLDAEVSDQRRVLLYDGDTFLAWVGVLRCDERRFTAAEATALDALVPRLRKQLAHAVDVERDEERVLPTGVVLGPSGEIAEMTRDASEFVHGGLAASLARAARRMHRDGLDQADRVVRGIHVRLSRLVGEGDPRTLAWLTPLPPPMLDPLAGLAPRIREAANYMATGATARETARAMQVSEHTVRGYLKEAYRALGVGSRVELATRLLKSRGAQADG